MLVFSFWQKNVHSTRFITYFCEHVLPNLSELTSPAAVLDIQLEVLKLLAEMSPFCGDMDKLEANLNMLFIKLLVRKRLGPHSSTETRPSCWAQVVLVR